MDIDGKIFELRLQDLLRLRPEPAPDPPRSRPPATEEQKARNREAKQRRRAAAKVAAAAAPGVTAAAPAAPRPAGAPDGAGSSHNASASSSAAAAAAAAAAATAAAAAAYAAAAAAGVTGTGGGVMQFAEAGGNTSSISSISLTAGWGYEMGGSGLDDGEWGEDFGAGGAGPPPGPAPAAARARRLFASLAPTTTPSFTADGRAVDVPKYFASMRPCPCGAAAAWDFTHASSHRDITAVSLLGKQGFNLASNVRCLGCSAARAQDTPDLVFGGWWPLTAGRPETFLEMRLLDTATALETAAPPLSTSALLQAINAQSVRFGGKGGLEVEVVKPTPWREALSQYRRALQDQAYHIQGINDQACCACGDSPHSVHVDGNVKLQSGLRDGHRKVSDLLPTIRRQPRAAAQTTRAA
ncbi:hypothetical protein Rsub_06057 [Raphidocelis subcapitata]|uniref:CxC3 like cysteine cluster domain-containing protein n=1 Tax=Raphidocelis subcapitata TaxID=307507 RepID=A0A2V0P9F3_9CHLO|nr:hypothetical protein Rsub_06057 [Raphidocelis subcapitata]|eukprot:GBF93725.1 hypothetical protein Rsub_06057 [Raphidocelis subcapitata]